MLIKSYEDTMKSILNVENNISIVCSDDPTWRTVFLERAGEEHPWKSKEIRIEDRALRRIIIFISKVMSSAIRTFPNNVFVSPKGTLSLIKRATVIANVWTDNHPTEFVIIGNLYFAEGLYATAYIRMTVIAVTKKSSGKTALK